MPGSQIFKKLSMGIQSGRPSLVIVQLWAGQVIQGAMCCLTGKAADYYSNLLDCQPDLHYHQVVSHLAKRYGQKDLVSENTPKRK